MIVTLDIKTGDVLGVRDSPGIPIQHLADSFARKTMKIWERELQGMKQAAPAKKKGVSNEGFFEPGS